MALRLIQLQAGDGRRSVAVLEAANRAVPLDDVESVYRLAGEAIAAGVSLSDAVSRRRTRDVIELGTAAGGPHLLSPIDHPDPAHLYMTGTGLTHLGSAESRDRMHALATAGGVQTDSMRMFLQGLEGGKPSTGQVGCQPEWFYKGNGYGVVTSGADLPMPSFALDGGEEAEIAGIYLIDPDGNPRRLGFCLANEFSDHVTERENYLWLAHSKLRPAALGNELLTGALPGNVQGTSALLRDGATIWRKDFASGEDNMSHAVANLEHHHFKYDVFRRPGDVHVHFFGCGTLSFSDGVETRAGDVFEIRADAFLLPLRNRLAPAPPAEFSVRPL